MGPGAKHLILDLMLAYNGGPCSIREVILACEVFSISENSARVAVARLSSAGMIEAAGRGSYRLGPMAKDLAQEVAEWRNAEQRLRTWSGGYICAYCGALGRSDRAALRRRDRALQILGFREYEKGLFLRPDNIDDGVETVRYRLYTLGLERQAPVFLAHGWETTREDAVRALWDGASLTHQYRQTREDLEAWTGREAELEPEVAARESFILGGRAIRQLVFDPLLPEPLVDVRERQAFIDAVKKFDTLGHGIWQRLMTETSTAVEMSAMHSSRAQ